MAENNKASFLSNLFDKKTVDILKSLLTKKDVFYLRDLSRDTGVSLATTFRIVQKLNKMGLVTKESNDKFTFYRINRGSKAFNEAYYMLIGLPADPIQILKNNLEEQFKEQYELFSIKGKKIFIVSSSIQTHEARQIVRKAFEETGKKLDFVVISPMQFEQMQKMGIISSPVTKI